MLRALLPFLILFSASAQNPDWKQPYPAHTIAGNLHYVGTKDLACFLLTDPAGHILINTGLADSTPLIREGIRQLGFKLEDVKILLTMQAHFDHVAAMAEVKRITGAKFYATAGDAPSLEDGGASDPAFGKGSYFAPVKVDRILKDGEVIRVGATELRVVETPGHSKGSVSYTTTIGGKAVAIVNMNTVVMPLVNPKYPQIVADFQKSFEKQRKLKPEIWVAAHASQYNMEAKHKSGNFTDPEGYPKAIDNLEKQFREAQTKQSAK